MLVQQKVKGGWKQVTRKDAWEVAALEDVNTYQSQQDLLEATTGYLALQGKAFWEISRNSKGKMTKIFTMHPMYTRVRQGGEFISDVIFQLPGDKPTVFSPKDTVFYKFFHPSNDFDGLSPLSAAREGVIADFYAQRYNKAFFKNGAVTRGALETEKGLSARAYKRLTDSFLSAYTGVDNQHKVAILEEGLKYKQVSLSPKDMEFINLRKYSREELMAVFGVYPVVLGLLEQASYANAYSQTRLFYDNTVSIYLTKIAGTLSYTLQQEMKNPDIRIYFDLTQVPALRPVWGDVMDWATPAVNSGIMLINEVRQILGLKPVPWGNTWYANSAMIPMADEHGIIPPAPAAGEPAPAKQLGLITGVGPEGPEYDIKKLQEYEELLRDELEGVKSGRGI
jgi:HK97 family phage portal protein